MTDHERDHDDLDAESQPEERAPHPSPAEGGPNATAADQAPRPSQAEGEREDVDEG